MAAVAGRSLPDKHQLARDLYFNQPEGFPYEGFDLQDVLLPPDDDLGVVSDDDEIPEESLDVETGYGSAVALDGLPVVPQEKYDKLLTHLMGKFAPHGEIKEGCFWMPQGEDGQTKGYAFIEYTKHQEARAACEHMNGVALDRKHTFKVYMMDELVRLEQVPDEYQQLELKPFNEKNYADTMAWLLDKRGRDQFLIQHESESQVFWDDGKKGQAELFYGRSFWSEVGPLTWSPFGTYIASMHAQGAVLWVSKADGKFEKVTRFSCPGVVKVDFSAQEELLTCYSVVNTKSGPEVSMAIFDCRSGRKLRVMQESLPNLIVGSMHVNQKGIEVPFLQWSPVQPALAAKLAHNAVQVYNGADMTLLDKRSIKLEGVFDAKWSPAENILAVYQQEHNNMPARVSLIELPEKKELRQKNLFMVASAKLYWHAQGKYLGVVTEKYTKSRKSTHTSIELFTLKSKGDVTNDMLELANKNDKVMQLAWEPRGDRFAVLHSEGSPHARPSVSFYTMIDKTLKDGAKLLGTIAGRQVSELHWSPAGRNILLAGLDGNTGALEFFNVDDMATLRTQQHFLCNHVTWDQTGRHVCSWVDGNRDMEHGYIIWSFTGEMLYRNRIDNFWNFAWRPRPPSQLPPEKDRNIVKNLKQYAKKFEEQDELLLAAADTELLQLRQKKRREWEAFLASKDGWLQQQTEYIESKVGYKLEEPAFQITEKEVQQVVDVKEEPFQA